MKALSMLHASFLALNNENLTKWDEKRVENDVWEISP